MFGYKDIKNLNSSAHESSYLTFEYDGENKPNIQISYQMFAFLKTFEVFLLV